MRMVRLLTLLLLQFAGQWIWAQAQPAPAPAPAPTIDAYIHQGWDTLSRSMSDCQSLVDPKVTTPPLLYLPYGAPTPLQLQRLGHRTARWRLPTCPIPSSIWGTSRCRKFLARDCSICPTATWYREDDSTKCLAGTATFIILGLLRDGRIDLAKGMVENFFYEIENYGAVLNANRTYFLTRSQPPFLSSMIRVVYDAEIAHDPSPANKARQLRWIAHAYPYARRDHDFWLSDIHRAGNTGLARFFDIGEGPVPDIADHSDYYIEVIKWLVDHPDVHTNYLVQAPENPSAPEQAELAKTSCDMAQSVVCKEAWSGGYRLSRDFYKGDRAVRESGFDISFRFGPFSGSTHHYAAVCLNSLLYKYELDLADFATMLRSDGASPAMEARGKCAAGRGHRQISLEYRKRECFSITTTPRANSPATCTRPSFTLSGRAWLPRSRQRPSTATWDCWISRAA